MSIGFSYYTLVGDMLIQYGCAPKEKAKTRINFQFEFYSPPTVLVTPEWTGADRNVGNEETIHSIENSYFELYSGNTASNYGVHWIALGSRTDVRPPSPPLIETDDWLIQFDKYPKSSSVAHLVRLPVSYSTNPATLISAFWENINSAVGHAETLIELRSTAVAIISNNIGSDYFVNWMTIGEKEGADLECAYDLPDGRMIQTGLVTKTSAALQIAFPRQFSRQPIVLVSPVFSRSGVGHAETLSSVNSDSFTLVSGNAGANYQVSWIAIG